MMNCRLDARVALITGSTRGIGLAMATQFAEAGATVIVNGRNEEGVAACVSALTAQGLDAHGVVFDVSSPAGVRGGMQAIFKQHQRLDVMVNNAGILEDALIGMIPDDMAERVYATNTIGALHAIQGAARLIMRGKGGSIINISSIVGVNGNEGQLAYAGSKAALIGMTKSAAKELAPHGIRVNAIAPGFIDTDMTRQLPPAKFEARLASIKMGRIGTVADVAGVALFLACDLSAYVTGQVIGVDGGMLI